MPNRIVRDGFLDSEAVHALSDAAECFFHRLLLAADDAGRMDGRVDMLRARLFPLDSSRRASDVEKAISECLEQALVIPYEWESRRYLQVAKWQRCSPCVNSKYPWADGSHRIAYVKRETRDGEKEFVATSIPSASHSDGIRPLVPPMSVDVDVDVDVDGNEGGKSMPRKRGAKDPPESFLRFWEAYPRRVAKPEALKAWKAAEPHLEAILADLSQRAAAGSWADPQFIPHPATYLRGERWRDARPAARAPPPHKPSKTAAAYDAIGEACDALNASTLVPDGNRNGLALPAPDGAGRAAGD